MAKKDLPHGPDIEERAEELLKGRTCGMCDACFLLISRGQ